MIILSYKNHYLPNIKIHNMDKNETVYIIVTIFSTVDAFYW